MGLLGTDCWPATLVQTGACGTIRTGACGTVVGLMVFSPGRREMEGTNDCTVGRRQRPDIAHKAQSKLNVSQVQPTVGEKSAHSFNHLRDSASHRSKAE